MKKLFIKIIYLIIFPIAIILIINPIHSIILHNKVLNDQLEEKLLQYPIDANTNNIIIAGDSRAERQLSPYIIKKITGINTINIATSSCDIVTLFAAIKKYYSSFSKSIFVISVSSFQINDGSIDKGYLSLKCFENLTLTDKISLYKINLLEMIRLEIELTKFDIKYLFNWQLYNKIPNSKFCSIINYESGFFPQEGTLNHKYKYIDLEEFTFTHPWYKNCKTNGARWLVLKKTLSEMGNINLHFILYQPPISPFWRFVTKNTFIDSTEKDYSQKLKIECNKYKNITFWDFYNNDIKFLNDSMYYDIQHLNKCGAEVFSNIISKKLQFNFK